MLVIKIAFCRRPAATFKSVLEHSFAQEILVTLHLQHSVMFSIELTSEAEPQMFLACS